MIQPLLEHPEIFLSEPMWYEIDDMLTPLQQYWALTGINDPSCLSLGVFDRSPASNRDTWHSGMVTSKHFRNYDVATLQLPFIPTIGANGAVFRASVLKTIDYHALLDVDKCYALCLLGHTTFAKVRIGIIHSFASNIHEYRTKARRKAASFSDGSSFIEQRHQGQPGRTYKYPWYRLTFFVLHVILVFPMIYFIASNYIKYPHRSWLYHFPVCLITLQEYSFAVLSNVRREVSH